MDDWEKFKGTSLPGIEDFCSHLKTEAIADADYEEKRVCKDVEITNLREYSKQYIIVR